MTGVMSFAWGIVQDVTKLKVNASIAKEQRIEAKEERYEMKSIVRELHWYIIKRNDVKVPQGE